MLGVLNSDPTPGIPLNLFLGVTFEGISDGYGCELRKQFWIWMTRTIVSGGPSISFLVLFLRLSRKV